MQSSEPIVRFNLPTILTLSRIVLIPFFIFVTPDDPVLGAAIFTLASLTDLLDGYLARKLGAITKFGIIVDPIADKFLVISALLLLVDMGRLSVWIATALIIREFLVTALRVVALSKGILIPAEMGGKLKVTAQFMGIVSLVLGGEMMGIDFYMLGQIFIFVALILALVSGFRYTVSFWKAI